MINRIRELRRKMDLSQKELAEKLGYNSQQQIAYYENTRRKLTSETAQKFANFFHVSIDYLVGNSDYDDVENSISYINRIPIVGSVSAGLPVYAEQLTEGYMSVPDDIRCDYVLKIEGDSMDQAGLPDGSYAFVRKQSFVDDGDIAVVVVNHEETLVKHFYQKGNIVTLKPDSSNPVHKEQFFDLMNTSVDIQGKVVWALSKL